MAASATHFLLLFFSLILFTATTVSAENQDLQLLQDGTQPPPKAPVTYKPSAPPVAKPQTPPTPTVATPPTPYRPPVKKEECGPLCQARCKLHSRPGLCVRACSTCCVRCKCVPPGTYGNRELCGKCYTEMRTHGDRPKCP